MLDLCLLADVSRKCESVETPTSLTSIFASVAAVLPQNTPEAEAAKMGLIDHSRELPLPQVFTGSGGYTEYVSSTASALDVGFRLRLGLDR